MGQHSFVFETDFLTKIQNIFPKLWFNIFSITSMYTNDKYNKWVNHLLALLVDGIRSAEVMKVILDKGLSVFRESRD